MKPTKALSLLLVLLPLAACSQVGDKPQTASATPKEVVQRVYDALNRGDTTEYLKYVCKTRLTGYRERPEALRETFQHYSVNKAEVSPSSEKINDNIALVDYRLRMTGPHPEDTTIVAQLYLEDGKWKYGW